MAALKSLLFRHRWLILVIFLAYAPFLHIRLVRTTGDEKVYIAQALEMKELGNYFVQVLAGRSDYYKGPLHYLLLFGGLKVFGLNLWAALYMNLILCIAGAVALAQIISEAFPLKKQWPFWAGIFFAFNAGVYGHFFASQMEVEIAGIYSIAFYYLWRGRGHRDELIFWLLTGLAGQFKSPLHSVLLGFTALLFWLWNGELWKRLFTPKSVLCIFAGILLCAAGYAPAFILDRENFYKIYILRETIKDSNGGPWWQALVPMLTYYLIPWMSLALLSYLELGTRWLTGSYSFRNLTAGEKRLWKLAFTSFAVTNVFFCYHRYHGENYAMGVTASVAMLMLLSFREASPSRFWIGLRKGIPAALSLLVLVLAVGIHLASERFAWPEGGWPTWFVPLVWVLALSAVALQFWESFAKGSLEQNDGLGIKSSLSKVAIMTIVGLVLAVVGEMEIYPLRQRLREDHAQGLHYSIRYWNISKYIWNEWGLMSLAVGEKIWPLLNDADILDAIQKGDLILARNAEYGNGIRELAQKHFPQLKPIQYDWPRWKTHAEDADGKSLIQRAWEKRDITLLFDHALILRFEAPKN